MVLSMISPCFALAVILHGSVGLTIDIDFDSPKKYVPDVSHFVLEHLQLSVNSSCSSIYVNIWIIVRLLNLKLTV